MRTFKTKFCFLRLHKRCETERDRKKKGKVERVYEELEFVFTFQQFHNLHEKRWASKFLYNINSAINNSKNFQIRLAAQKF